MTAIPILLVGGYLGAGKTTLINGLLTAPGSRRIAAIINDFGEINIDASLLSHVSDSVIGLKNGCICCSLQGDLLATLSTLTRQTPPPDAIVIETSGVANPADIVRALLDPVIFRATPLDTVVTLVDQRFLVDAPEVMEDPLWRAQLDAADYLLLTKSDLVSSDDRSRLRTLIASQRPGAPVFETQPGNIPTDILFGHGISLVHQPILSKPSISNFEAAYWTSSSPLSFSQFQNAIRPIVARCLRSKGLLRFADNPEQTVLFQSVGLRATIASSTVPVEAGMTAQLVVIGRRGELKGEEISQELGQIEISG